jgi:putative Mn2+ efflux pump MntP
MVMEGLREEPEDEDVEEEAASFRLSRLLLLGLATSIDSAAVGITLPLLEFPIGLAIAIIGAASFVLTIVALYLADRVAGRFSERLEVAGGLVLVGIGVKILVEHLRGGG